MQCTMHGTHYLNSASYYLSYSLWIKKLLRSYTLVCQWLINGLSIRRGALSGNRDDDHQQILRNRSRACQWKLNHEMPTIIRGAIVDSRDSYASPDAFHCVITMLRRACLYCIFWLKRITQDLCGYLKN